MAFHFSTLLLHTVIGTEIGPCRLLLVAADTTMCRNFAMTLLDITVLMLMLMLMLTLILRFVAVDTAR